MSNTGEIVVVATIVPQAERRDDVREALTHAIGRVHNEDEGCLLYALHEHPDAFVMIEKWKDAETLKAHSQSEGYLELQGALKDRLAGVPEVKFLTAIPVGNDRQGTL